MQIDTLRPLAVRKTGPATVVPSGTVASVTADNNDATYVNYAVGASGNWSVRMDPHTVPAGYQRHLVRGRVRARTDAGTVSEDIDLGEGTSDYVRYGTVNVTDTVAELATAWFADFAETGGNYDPGPITTFNMGAGYPHDAAGGATAVRIAELYMDIDCRQQPQYAAEVRDAAGVSQNGGTVTDTDSPTIWFGTPAYDGLAANTWSVTVSGPGGIVYTQSATGAPPESLVVTPGLADGNYTATFVVASTIRSSSPFPNQQVVSFTVNNIVPPPSPPLLSIEREADGYRLTWENPGGQTWDDDYVITEVWRDDCAGSWRIAAVLDGLNGSYLDQNVPQLDGYRGPDSAGVCLTHDGTCDITYRVRYWGYVSTTVTLPTTVPVALVIAWPGQNNAIPSGWVRVTDLDGFYPRGATGTGTPTLTGGAATHTHATPPHQHTFPSHTHSLPSRSETSGTSTTTTQSSAGRSLVSQPHSHVFPQTLGASGTSLSGSTAAGSNAVSNQPASREVIWIRSDGSATQYPIGALAFSAQTVSGWTADGLSSGRYLKGAVAAGNGGAQVGAHTHTHSVLSHTHTGGQHDHPAFTTGIGSETSSEGLPGAGPASPEWLGQHTHTANPISTGAGTLPAATGGTTGSSSIEPVNRRLRVLRNTGGGLQTRIIGLYTGAISGLPAGLTYCNGSGGTPDMRGWFARDIGTASVNTTGGAATHNHSVPTHVHAATSHDHTVSLAVSGYTSYRRGATSTISVPTETHVHPTSNSGTTSLQNTPAGNGTSGNAANLPPYKEVHFVRLDGTVDGGVLPTPEQRVTEYASVTVPAVGFFDDLDRLSSLAGTVLALLTDRDMSYPRSVTDSTPIDGGLHTVSTTDPGEVLSLDIAVTGKSAIDALEVLLSQDRVYWAPVGGQPGWFAVDGWSVAGPAPEVKVLTVSMVRQPWPAVPDPANLL